MKHRISEVGARMLKYQEQLARDYGYKPIPRTFFCDVRAEFQKALRYWQWSVISTIVIFS